MLEIVDHVMVPVPIVVLQRKRGKRPPQHKPWIIEHNHVRDWARVDKLFRHQMTRHWPIILLCPTLQSATINQLANSSFP